MRRWLHPHLVLVLIPLTLLIIGGFLIKSMRNAPISPQHILRTFPDHLETRSACSLEKVQQILSQSYAFLGEGAQCYVLASQDGRYVIKFFKPKHIQKKKWLKSTPLFSVFIPQAKKDRAQKRWLTKFQTTCHRYLLAFDELREETGLIYLHFQPSKDRFAPLKIATSSDKIALFDLNQYTFILQEKGECIPEKIASLLRKGDKNAALKSLLQLKQLLKTRAQKRYTDVRQCFSINYAFTATRAIQIDVGKITKDLHLDVENEVNRVTNHLIHWTTRHFPELVSDLYLLEETTKPLETPKTSKENE